MGRGRRTFFASLQARRGISGGIPGAWDVAQLGREVFRRDRALAELRKNAAWRSCRTLPTRHGLRTHRAQAGSRARDGIAARSGGEESAGRAGTQVTRIREAMQARVE